MNPYINIHTHKNNIDKEFIEITNIDVDNHVNVDVPFFYSLGIHPWECQQPSVNNHWLENRLDNLASRCLNDSSLKAIGECGIDRVCNVDLDIQKAIFIKQIEISEQYNKPMIIHAVKSHSDLLSIRKETKAKMPWIIHGFQGNEHIVSQYLRHDIYLSLGDVLFKNESKATELLKHIPHERLFMETDISERSIVDVYERAALLSGHSTDELRSDIFNNFVKIFGKI